MSTALPYSDPEIVHQAKISGHIPSLLEGIANRNIILNAAQTHKIEVSEAEIQHGADQLRRTYQLTQAADTWTWMNQSGLTLDDFEEMVYVSVLSNKLSEYLFSKKAEALFCERQIDYMRAALYEILFEDEDVALELYYTIKEGENSFHDVAKQYSSDPELGRKGGYLGWVNRTNLQPEVRASVFAAQPPQLLEPVHSSKGVHLILVEEITQLQLTPTLKQQLISELFFIWLKQHRESLRTGTGQGNTHPALE